MEKNPTLFADFANRNEAENAVSALEGLGIGAADISIITKEGNQTKATDAAGDVVEGALGGAATGGVVGGLAGLLAGVGVVPALTGILIGGPIAAALGLAGAAATTVSGAVTGAVAGGLIGGLAGLGLSEDDARYYSDAVDNGAIVLAVQTTEDNEGEVRAVLEGLSDEGVAAAGVDTTPERRVRRILV
jgi:hypothetical protein